MVAPDHFPDCFLDGADEICFVADSWEVSFGFEVDCFVEGEEGDEVVVVELDSFCADPVEAACHGLVVAELISVVSASSARWAFSRALLDLCDACDVQVTLEVTEDDFKAKLHPKEAVDAVTPFSRRNSAEVLGTEGLVHGPAGTAFLGLVLSREWRWRRRTMIMIASRWWRCIVEEDEVLGVKRSLGGLGAGLAVDVKET